MDTIIKVQNLCYGNILDQLNLNIYKNTINYISGSNNCGKSTFIKILSGEIDTKNMIFYQNKDINDMSSYEISTTIGKVMTLDFDFNFSTVSQEILYKLDKLNLDRNNHKKRYNYIVSLLNMRDILNKNTQQLSEFEKLKLLIGLELLTKPKILFINNLFTYIKKRNIEDIISVLRSIDDITVVISSNDLSFALYSDYLHLFNKGKLILSGPTLEVLKKDSIINKLGLDLPFMVDLSLKLKYYDLVEDIELDMNRMVNILWK